MSFACCKPLGLRHSLRRRLPRASGHPLIFRACILPPHPRGITLGDGSSSRGDRFVAHTGFDPRAVATPYRWFRISPRRIQAWREVNEMPHREGGPA